MIENLQNSEYPENANRVIDLAGQILREQNGPNSFPELLEIPKSPRFYEILDLTNQAVQEVFPGAYENKAEQVLWLPVGDFKEVYNSHFPDTFTTRNLLAVGGRAIIGKDDRDKIIMNTILNNPPLVLLRTDVFQNIDSDDILRRSQAEYLTVRKLIETSIQFSTIVKKIQNPRPEGINSILNQLIDLELKRLPKEFPEMNMEEFTDLMEGYRNILQLDESSRVEVDGSVINFKSTVPDRNGDLHEEDLFSAGRDLRDIIVNYLSREPFKKVLNILANNYPEDKQKNIRTIFNRASKEDSFMTPEAHKFLTALKINSQTELFNAYYESIIPELYLEAVKKNKNLGYPVL